MRPLSGVPQLPEILGSPERRELRRVTVDFLDRHLPEERVRERRAATSVMQRYFRDARLQRFSPISNEMIRNLLGERLGLPRSY